MMIRMNLARLVIVDSAEEKASMIILREANGDRAFPILIGVHEAYAIDRRMKGSAAPRPMTHDLLTRIIKDLDADLEEVVISELRDQTFFARLVLRHDGQLIEVDSRPSDAIALSAGTDTPIMVDESVLREVC